MHHEDLPKVLEHIEQCADEGTDFEMEFRVVGPDGGPTWLYGRGKIFFDRDGQPSYITGACVELRRVSALKPNCDA